ncbi:hypothetical protein TCAL_13337, partial [Tigriopus californicus]|eukprot:TCALIF_13337-PA protein Name:"Protein of unknown function" AED:0.33 eAED:0.33 QI:79/0.33/0/0.57/0.83/0.57/7/0/1696
MLLAILLRRKSQDAIASPTNGHDHQQTRDNQRQDGVSESDDLKSRQDSFCLTRIIFGLVVMVLLLIISTACAVSYIQASDAPSPLPPTSSLVSQSAKTYHSVFRDQNFYHNDTNMDFSQGVTSTPVDQEESEANSANPNESAIFEEKSWYEPAVNHEKDQWPILDGSASQASDNVTDHSLDKRILDLSDNLPSQSNASMTETLPDPSARIGSYNQDSSDSFGHDDGGEYVDEEELEFLDPDDIIETFQDFTTDDDDDTLNYAGENRLRPDQFAKRYMKNRRKPFRRNQSYRGGNRGQGGRHRVGSGGGRYNEYYNDYESDYNFGYWDDGPSYSGPRDHGDDYDRGSTGSGLRDYSPPRRNSGVRRPQFQDSGPRGYNRVGNRPVRHQTGYRGGNAGYGPPRLGNGPINPGPVDRRDGPPGYSPPPPNPFLHQMPGPPYPFPPPRAPNKPLDNTRIHPSKLDPVYQNPDGPGSPKEESTAKHLEEGAPQKAKRRNEDPSGKGATVIVVHQESPYPLNIIQNPVQGVQQSNPHMVSHHISSSKDTQDSIPNSITNILNRTLNSLDKQNIYNDLGPNLLLDGILPPEPPPRPPGPPLDVSLLNKGLLRENSFSKRMGSLGEFESMNVMSRVPPPPNFLANRLKNRRKPNWQRLPRIPGPNRNSLMQRRRPLPPLHLDDFAPTRSRRPIPSLSNRRGGDRHGQSQRRGPYHDVSEDKYEVELNDEDIEEDFHYDVEDHDEDFDRYNPNRGPSISNRRYQDVGESLADDPYSITRPYQDVQSLIDEEFQNNFQGFPKRVSSTEETYPPNIFNKRLPSTSPEDEYPNTVYIHPPTTRSPILRPPPLHPGVDIPGVSHPQDSGNIQDIIHHADGFNERIDYGHRNKNNADIELHEDYLEEEHGGDEGEKPSYSGYRPPIGYKGPTHPPSKVYHYPSYPGTNQYHPEPPSVTVVENNHGSYPNNYHHGTSYGSSDHDDDSEDTHSYEYTPDRRPKLPQVFTEVSPIKFDKHFNKFRPTEDHSHNTHDYEHSNEGHNSGYDHDHDNNNDDYNHPDFPKNPVFRPPQSTVIPPVFANNVRPESFSSPPGPDIYDGNGQLYPPDTSGEVIEHFEYKPANRPTYQPTSPPKPVPPPPVHYRPPSNFDTISQGIFNKINNLSNRIPNGPPGVHKPPQVLTDTYSQNDKPEVNMFPVPPESVHQGTHADNTKYHNHNNHNPTYHHPEQHHHNLPTQRPTVVYHNQHNDIYLPAEHDYKYNNANVYDPSHKPSFDVHNHKPETTEIYTPNNPHGPNTYVEYTSIPGNNHAYQNPSHHETLGHRPAVPLDYDPTRPDGPDYSTGTGYLEDKLFDAAPSPPKSHPMSIGLDVYPMDGTSKQGYPRGSSHDNKHEVLLHLNLFSKKPLDETNSVSIGPFSYNFERDNDNRRIQNDRMYHSIDQAPIIEDSPVANVRRKHLMEVMKQYGKTVLNEEETADDSSSHPLFGHINPVNLLKVFVDRSKQRMQGHHHTSSSNTNMIISKRKESQPPNLQNKETIQLLTKGKPWYGDPADSDSKPEPPYADFTESVLHVEDVNAQELTTPKSVIVPTTDFRPRQNRLEPDPAKPLDTGIPIIKRNNLTQTEGGEKDYEYYYYYYYDYVDPDDEELSNSVESLPNPSYQKLVSNGTLESDVTSTPKTAMKRQKVRRVKKGPPRKRLKEQNQEKNSNPLIVH